MLNNSLSLGRGNGDRLSPDVANLSNESSLRGSQCKSTNISFRNQSNTFQESHKHNEARSSWHQQSTQRLCDSFEQSVNLSPHSYNQSSTSRQLLLPSSSQTNNLEQTNSNNLLHISEREIDKQVPNNVHQFCISLENQKANSPNTTHNVNEQIASHLINYTSANVISPNTSFYRGNSVAPSYLSITQFHYQNIPPESNIHYPPSLPIGYASLPSTSALTPSLLFEPPPRDGRSYQNLAQNNYQIHDALLSLESNPTTCNTDRSCQKRTSETCIRCSISYDHRQLNQFRATQNNNIKETCQHKNGISQLLNNPKTSSATSANTENIVNNTSNSVSENKLNIDGCMNSDRANLKLKLCKNVVNVPKQMENIIHIDCAESPIYNCEKSHSKRVSNEDIIVNGEFNCPKIQENKSNNNNNNNMLRADEIFSRFDTLSDREFVDLIIEGLNTGEEIATKYQNIPCFKNIKRLCEKTKNIVMTPHCTHRNIHSQGVPWATKDYIFVFTRLTSIWYLLKGYLGQKSEVFNKIEKLYSPKLRTSFEMWEKASIQLSVDILETFIALGNNSRGKWSPKAHSTPLYNSEQCLKNTVPFGMFPSSRIEEESKETGLNRQYAKNDNEFKSDSRFSNKTTNMQSSSTPLISKNGASVKENSKNRIIKPPTYNNEIDSDDEDLAKKYIKPGSYAVPELKNMVPVIKPRTDISNIPLPIQSDNDSFKTPTQNHCGLTKQSIFKNMHVASELKMGNASEPMKISKYGNRIESDFVPFKNTPQGKMHSALLKLNSVDVPETPKYPTSEYKNLILNGKKDQSFSSADSEDAVSFQSVFLLNYVPEKIDVSTQISIDEYSNYDSDVILCDTSEIVKREYPTVSSLDNHNLQECEKYSSKSSSLISSAFSSSSSDNLNEFNKYNSNHSDRNTYKTHKSLTRSKSVNNKPLQTRKEYRNRESKIERVETNNAKRFMNSSNMQQKRSNTKLFKCTIGAKNSHTNDKKFSQKKEIDTLNISSWYNKYRGCLTRNVSEKFKNIVNTLYKMSNSSYFYFEVDINNISDYYQIVKSPIFIINVQEKLDDCKYKDMYEVVDDIRNVFKNAHTFFSVHPNKEIEDITEHFSSVFEKLLNETFPNVDFSPR